MKRSEKKRKQKKVVLMFTLATAAVIVGGMTFAWFSSQDTVTNRLEANNNYKVLITETYTPEKDWIPGEAVDKEVMAVNTGNTEAYARLGFLDKLITKTADGTATVVGSGTPTINDSTAVALGALKMADPNYGKVDTTDNTLDKTAEKEAIALQAGGFVVYNKDHFVTDGTNEINSSVLYGTADGLYIFRREIGGTSDATKYAYSGYYVKNGKYYALTMEKVAADNLDDMTVSGLTVAYTTTADGTPTVDSTGSNSVANVSVPNVKLNESTAYTFTYSLVKENYDTAGADDVSANGLEDAAAIKVTASKDNGTDDDIVVYLVLDSAAKNNYIYVNGSLEGKEGFVQDENEGIGHFVYNKVLGSGTTSDKLITDVVLSKKTSNSAYIDLTYDINVVLDSVQAISSSQDGSESYDGASVSEWGVTVASGDGSLTKTPTTP